MRCKMKKFLPYGIFSAIAMVVSVVLSVLFDVSLSNTWQGMLAVLLGFGPLWVCGWKETTVIKSIHPGLFVFCRFCFINLALGYILGTVLLFVGFFH